MVLFQEVLKQKKPLKLDDVPKPAKNYHWWTFFYKFYK